MSLDYSVVFNLIKMIVAAILKSAGVFEELESFGINPDKILAMFGIDMGDSAEPTL